MPSSTVKWKGRESEAGTCDAGEASVFIARTLTSFFDVDAYGRFC